MNSVQNSESMDTSTYGVGVICWKLLIESSQPIRSPYLSRDKKILPVGEFRAKFWVDGHLYLRCSWYMLEDIDRKLLTNQEPVCVTWQKKYFHGEIRGKILSRTLPISTLLVNRIEKYEVFSPLWRHFRLWRHNTGTGCCSDCRPDFFLSTNKIWGRTIYMLVIYGLFFPNLHFLAVHRTPFCVRKRPQKENSVWYYDVELKSSRSL